MRQINKTTHEKCVIYAVVFKQLGKVTHQAFGPNVLQCEFLHFESIIH
jgi:hypothetical protein